jgi:prepilin-type N-terminal cleavage/methylation domain-containing protein
MTHSRLRFIHQDQRGFTLVEMLVVLVLIGIITGGITAGIMQVLTINSRASNHMIAVRQVQQAGKEVSKDTLQSQNVTCGNYSGFPLTLTWTDWEGTDNEVVYTIIDETDSNALQRSHNVTGVRAIAQYIDISIDPTTGKAKTNCHCDEEKGVLTFTVTATVGNGPYQAIETRVYQIKRRPGS